MPAEGYVMGPDGMYTGPGIPRGRTKPLHHMDKGTTAVVCPKCAKRTVIGSKFLSEKWFNFRCSGCGWAADVYPWCTLEVGVTTDHRSCILAEHLEVDQDDITCVSEELFENMETGSRYLVLTRKEADTMVLENLVEDFPEIHYKLASELNNLGVYGLFDVEAWAKQTLTEAGCGPSLAHYGSEEYEHKGMFIYRQN